MQTSTFRGVFTLTLMVGTALAAQSASAACRSIQFERGASSASVKGVAPADGVDCLRFGTGNGQDVQIAVRSRADAVAFSIDGVTDDRQSFRFRSAKKTYELRVFQTMKAVAPVAYELDLAIR